MSKTIIDDTENLNVWQSAMKMFGQLASENASKDHFLKWKEKYVNQNVLTFRQKDAVAARADNWVDGTYGKSKDGIKFAGA